MNVAVVGAGALGTLFAGRLAAAGTDVTLVGRPGGHVEAIQRDGIEISGVDPIRGIEVEATTDHDAVAGSSWLLLAVKSYDTAEAMASVGDALASGPIVTVQNGLGNAETIADFVAPQRVVVGTTSHGATLDRPGVVDHAGRGDTVLGRYFGEADASDVRVETVAATLSRAGIETTVTDRPRDALWEKVIVNVAINAATALARVPNGHLVRYGPGKRLLERAAREALAVARAEGRSIDESVVDRARAVARTTASNRSSMRRDVESGSRTEIESLNGAVVSLAEEHDVSTPVNRTLADLVRLTRAGADD
ncbi:MAG: ketopantoate reductase family protein [Halanaeroarchaeum sp.]